MAKAVWGLLALSLCALIPREGEASNWQKGRVVRPRVPVYKGPDFSAPVIGYLKGGSQWMISTEIYGAFYKVRIRNRIAYVTDVDIRPLVDPKKAAQEQAKKKEEERAARRRLTFDLANFWGIQYASLRYREQTMGLRPTDQLSFLGFNLTGAHIVIDGYSTAFNFLVSMGPPRYYQQATGQSADGFVMQTNFLFQYNTLHSRNTMTFFGFGPMYKYSKIGVTLDVNGQNLSYSLDDMSVGAIFNWGIAQRFGDFALRGELQYYWEKTQYYGLSISTQFAF